jgi:hypothetical protein
VIADMYVSDVSPRTPTLPSPDSRPPVTNANGRSEHPVVPRIECVPCGVQWRRMRSLCLDLEWSQTGRFQVPAARFSLRWRRIRRSHRASKLPLEIRLVAAKARSASSRARTKSFRTRRVSG